MRPRLPRPESVVGGLIVAAILGVSVWFATAAPCEVYSFTAAKEIPGRCVMP